eukprot:433247_1
MAEIKSSPKYSYLPKQTNKTTISFTAGKQWRNSEIMDQLSDEEQIRHIYNTSKNKHFAKNKNIIIKGKDNSNTLSISKSLSLSFASGAILNNNWRQVKLYILWKSIVWLFIGISIFYVNRNHQNMLTTKSLPKSIGETQQYCCQCYEYALKYSKRRVDWSYCTQCIDCNKCKYNNYTNTNNSYETNPQCDGAVGIFPHKCDADTISTTSMVLFYKNYDTYGWGALIICLLYVTVSLLLLTAEKSDHYIDSIGVLLLVYNIVVSMVCFYMIGKPYQYQKTDISIDIGEPGAYCYVDTLSEIMEDILTAFINTSMGLLALQWLFCCCKCWTKRRRNENYNCFTSAAERYYIYITVICGILFGIVMLACVLILIYETIIHTGSIKKLQWLVIIDIILLICCFDIFCCPFC